jgi:ribosome maturation factor RimP
MNEESQAAPIDETSWILQVEKIAEEVALREGCILYDVEFLGGRILRISIDKDIISHNVMHDPAAQAAVDSQPDIQSLIHDENSGEVEELSGDSEAGLGTGVGIKDCSRVANGLNELVNLDDLVPGGNYNLEVSTPGVDRQLKKTVALRKSHRSEDMG